MDNPLQKMAADCAQEEFDGQGHNSFMASTMFWARKKISLISSFMH